MLDFVFRRSIFNIRECSFCSVKSLKKIKNVDVINLHSNDSGDIDIKKSVLLQKQYTLLNKLTVAQDELSAKIEKRCKDDIRRAEREGICVYFYDAKNIEPSNSIIDCFEKIYNQMFIMKGLDGYRFNRALIEKGIISNSIIISRASNSAEDNEVYHAYLYDEKNCVLMYSASTLWTENDKEKIKEIGRMNKYLHWKDMLYFKNMGLENYEWGGIRNPTNPNGIDIFKMKFGGDLVQYNNYLIPVSFLGKLYAILVKIKGRMK